MPDARIKRYVKHGTLPQLAVFEASARLGSFTRAAEALHMAQPTVSVQIRKLSETVGLPLFEQVGRRMFLTDAGRLLYASCAQLFGAISKVEDSFATMRGLTTGRLRLAVGTPCKYLAPRMLAGFAQRHPGVEVSLQIHNRDALTGRLADNEDDLYIFANPPRDAEVVRQRILPNPMVVYARPDDPLVREKRIALSRLAQQPFLMREPGSGTRMVAQALFERHGLAPCIRMELGSNEALMQAILAGLGVAIMARDTFGLDPGQRRLVSLDVEGFPLEGAWYFVYPVGKELSLVGQAFMDFVRTEAQLMVRDSSLR